jgi:hypothetical protein
MKRLLLDAAKGNPDAQFNVGVIFDNAMDDNGYGVSRKRGEAIKWLHLAARQGLPRAQSRLAEVYADGTGSRRDAVRACGWFLLAMTNLRGAHHQKAKSGFVRVSSTMTQAEIASAHRFADSRRPKRPAVGIGSKAKAATACQPADIR